VKPAIRFIRFTRRIARQCSAKDARVRDWAVCDTIANGSRQPLGRRGIHGGAIVRFERTYLLASRGKIRPVFRKATVAVVAERIAHGCIALHLLSSATGRGKNWNDLGFLNRAGSK